MTKKKEKVRVFGPKEKVKVLKGFALNLQGSYFAGQVVTLHFGRIKDVGVLSPQRFQKLLELGSIEVVEEEEVTDGEV